MKKSTPTETFVSQAVASEKPKVYNIETKLIERTCKILDAVIMEVMPHDQPIYQQSIFITLSDIRDKTVLKLNIQSEDLEKLNINLNTKSMIELCAWLKKYTSAFTIVVPEDVLDITVDMFFNHLPSESELMQISPSVDLSQEQVAVGQTMVVKRKFGRNQND
jgi:hypothetical protein